MSYEETEKITIPELAWYNDKKMSAEEKWERVGLENNFIFYRVMTDNPKLCKRVIEILLQMKIERIEIKTEDTMQLDPFCKGIRLDVYAKGDEKLFNLEMQTLNTGELPERARYYQGVLDVDNLKHGNLYKTLPDSYVIFICLNDIFKKGLPVYTFENICLEDNSIKMNDRTQKLFFCVKNCDKILNQEQKEFLYFLARKSNYQTAFTDQLTSEVHSAKQSMQAKVAFMEWERIKAYAKDEGFRQGIIEGASKAKLEDAISMINELNISVDKAAEIVKIDLAELKSALAQHNAETK